jgi:hypothetical protein
LSEPVDEKEWMRERRIKMTYMQFITGTIILCKRIKKKQRALEQGAKNPELQKKWSKQDQCICKWTSPYLWRVNMQEAQAVRSAQHESYLNFQALDKLGITEINVQRKAPASFIDYQK